MNLGKMLAFAILAFVGMSLAFELIPEITALNHAETGIVGTVLDVSIWLIPAAIGVGILMAGIRHFTGKRGG